jgi:hypothetical protein
MIGTRRLVLMAAAISIASSSGPDVARSAESQTPTSRNVSNDTPAGLDTVTIEAKRKQELKREISHFVSDVAVRYLNDSLTRWNKPICPLVTGLTKERGEFLLARLSQIATDSHAPLAGEHCSPNFFVVVTADLDVYLKKWMSRSPTLVNSCNGAGYIKHFMQSREPVRVWYNAEFRSSDGAALSSDTPEFDVSRLSLSLNSCAPVGSELGTRLRFSDVQAFTHVIIVIDLERTANFNIGQLSDYVAMVGLTQIRLDKDTGTAPTILRLFRESDQPPQGLSRWDQAFLNSLYTTAQASVLEVSTIKSKMFEEIEH